MQSSIATLLTFTFIIVLVLRDQRMHVNISGALWIPVLWMVIAGSRFVSQWMSLGSVGTASVEQEVSGSPIDVIYFLTLIILGIRVLVLRRVAMIQILKNNLWLTLFFIYCFLAIGWSDFPVVAFKRYIKVTGHLIMALIILSDPYPVTAMRIVMKRCAYLLIPLSVLFIKFYPQYGRGFDGWSGSPSNNGVMLTKSELGIGCMLFGIFFYWNLLTARRIENRTFKRDEILLSIVFLTMVLWLQHMSHSSTTLVCLVIGVGAISALGLDIVSKRFIGTYVIIAVFIVAGAEWMFNIYENILEILGEDPTLTDRTLIWADCLALVKNPIFGEGFETFWMGERLEKLWEKWWWRPNQAHNGYIEIYLNLGIIGLILLTGLLIASFRKIGSELLTNFDTACLKFGYFFAILGFNCVEASFKGVAILWTVFHIIVIDYPKKKQPKEELKASEVQKKSMVFHRYKKKL